MVRMPSRMILRLGWEEEEKVDQREVMAALSENDSASSDWNTPHDEDQQTLLSFCTSCLIQLSKRGDPQNSPAATLH